MRVPRPVAVAPKRGDVPNFAGVPAALKRQLYKAVLKRVQDLEGDDSSDGTLHRTLIWLYRGTERPDKSRVPWTVRSWEAWAFFLEDAAAAGIEIPTDFPLMTASTEDPSA